MSAFKLSVVIIYSNQAVLKTIIMLATSCFLFVVSDSLPLTVGVGSLSLVSLR